MTADLQADVVVRRGSFLLDARLRVEPGEVLALLGPNGAGKSTLLNALAGLIQPESGSVTVSGRALTRQQARGAAVALPPERRSVGLLGQAPLLFPHLTAVANVAFGRASQGIRKKDAVLDARGWLGAVGLGGFEERKPAALSGGQQQRVAIARALAARPDVLLLDEPMAALDVQTAVTIRQLLHEQLSRGQTTVLVTHDVVDALVLADRVAILHDGRIIDDGPKTRVLGAPKNQFIAALAGVNLVVGSAVGAVGHADGWGSVQLADGRRFTGRSESGSRVAAGADISAVFRPSAVRVQTARAHAAEPLVARGASADAQGTAQSPSADAPGELGSGGLNAWQATIAGLEPSASGVRVRLVGDENIVAECSPAEVAKLGLEPARRVWLSVAASDVAIHVR